MVINRLLNKFLMIINTKFLFREKYSRRNLNEFQMIEELNCEQKKRPYPIFCVSIDDYFLTYSNYLTHDYGIKKSNGVTDILLEYIENNEWFKPTIFAIAKPTQIYDGRNVFAILRKLFLKPNSFNPNTESLLVLQKNNSIDIAIHGYNHNSNLNLGYLPFCEFLLISKLERINRINKAKLFFNSLNIKFSGFKPPAWLYSKISNSTELSSIVNEFQGFKYLCLSTPNNGLNQHKFFVSHINTTSLNEYTHNIPQNINLCWPIDRIISIMSQIVCKNGIVHVQLHYCPDNVLEDGISPKNLEKIKQIYTKFLDLTDNKGKSMLLKDIEHI